MQALSVVIICKNEEAVIGETLQSLQGLTDDIIVYDNGSTDTTAAVVAKWPVQFIHGAWEGFGLTKMKANAIAKYNWILSLDADEPIDDELKKSLLALDLNDEQVVYEIKFRSFLGNQYLRYGEWGGDKHIRLFNRKWVKWDDAPVHEELIIPAKAVIKKIPGFVLHRTMKDIDDYAQKMALYAMLNAEKYRQQGKKSSWFKIHMAPGFTFFNYYFLKLGFLDGPAGYTCAKMTAYYTFLKYARLKELERNNHV